MKNLKSIDNFLIEQIEIKPGTKLYHKKFGLGFIIKDIEGLCKKDEVLFSPVDKSTLPDVMYPTSALRGPQKEKADIVKISDLSLNENINEGDANIALASERENQATFQSQIGKLKNSMSLIDRGNKPDSQKMLDKAKLTAQIGKLYIQIGQSMGKESMFMQQAAKIKK